VIEAKTKIKGMARTIPPQKGPKRASTPGSERKEKKMRGSLTLGRLIISKRGPSDRREGVKMTFKRKKITRNMQRASCWG